MWNKKITRIFAVQVGNNRVTTTDDGLHDLLDSVLESSVGNGIRRAQLRLLNALLNAVLDGQKSQPSLEREEA